MARIYESIERLIGHTPILELSRIGNELKLKARILAKLEMFNPAGSAKDRAAVAMLDDAEARGIIKSGATVIEPTSGNTGIALACVASLRGYNVIIVMPDTMSAERRKLMKAYGAKLVLTDGKKGMKGAIEKAESLSREIKGSFIPSQFTNPANARAHYLTTGPEIYSDCEGNVDCFVCGVGTGGTITGVGRYLKEHNPEIKIIAVEPAASPVLSRGVSGAHGIQGIGAGFVPEALDVSVYDEVMTVTQSDAYSTARLIGVKEGVAAGISSGAAAWAAIQVAQREAFAGKTVVTLFPDGCDRYLSTDLYGE